MSSRIFLERERYSDRRLSDLATRLKVAPETKSLKDFTIFCAGSYARREASKHSDIDLFFIYLGERNKRDEPRTDELRLFGSLIHIVKKMRFPKFSNDCQYLEAYSGADILKHLGSRRDDYDNFFTVRMLMLLESSCVFGASEPTTPCSKRSLSPTIAITRTTKRRSNLGFSLTTSDAIGRRCF